MEFDKPRARRIVGEWLEDNSAILEDRQSDESYTSPEAFLKDDAELRQDRRAMEGLYEQLERDCE